MAFLPAFFLLAATATATATSTAECCDLLAQTFPSQLVLPDSNSYNASTSSYFFMQQRVLAPTCIVQPKSDEDVSKVVKTIQSCTDVEVAIRSGGHSPNVGFSNANAGVTIDLRGLNKIELSADGNTVELGTGNEWVNVYEKLDPLGKSVVGARVADVGVGGFLSGGKSKTYIPSYQIQMKRRN
jgi:FAD/FMN-containing dehydrogenase